MTLTVPFAGRELSLRLPSGWQVLSEVRPVAMAPLDDPKAALREALSAPIGRAPLGSLEGKRVVVAVDDGSRPTPAHLYFDVVLDWLLAAGARREDLLLLPALGVHRPMTRAELEAKVGAGSLEGLEVASHDCKDPKALVSLGRTSRGTPVLLNRHLVEADLVVCVGAIEPHLLLGFGGGLKMLIPGLAGAETIAKNHMQGVSPERFNYVGERDSAMRLDLEEGAQKLRADLFVVNVVMNEALEPCRFVCGDPVAAHRAGVETVEAIAGRPVPAQADVAIVVSNPMNADLRQGMKCLGNVAPAVREGGVVVALLECRNGVGDVAVPERNLPHPVLRGLLRLAGKDRVLGLVDLMKRGAGIEERFLAHFSLQVARSLELLVHSPNLPLSLDRRLGVARLLESPEALVAAAAKAAPRRARVIVFPSGGATYPILPASARR